mgnify:CR=1 FL=1
MCRIYNTIGCLNTIQIELVRNNIDDFTSINQLIDFQKKLDIAEQEIITYHKKLIQDEKVFLENEISELNILIPQKINDLEGELRQKLNALNQEIENLPETNSKIIATIKDYWINLVIHLKFWFIQFKFLIKIIFFKHSTKRLISEKNKRFEYISTNFQDAINESSSIDLQSFELKKGIVNTLNNTIYGAIGEQKTENALKKLSDDYILINDFCYTFSTPIRYKSDFIKSIQIDHLLISQAGIFIIETKNWSSRSLDNLDLHSPVQQILRTNYALFRLLDDNAKKYTWNFTRQHWGNRKIPIKNIIVFTNNAPKEQFQFVKILGLHKLISYVQYFNPSFTTNEIESINNYLLNISQSNKVTSKLSM